MRLRIQKFAVYTGYLLLLTGVWGVFLFPSDELIGYVQCGLSQVAPDAKMSIGRLGPSLLTGLTAENVALSLHNRFMVQADHIRVLPGLFSLFQDRSRRSLIARFVLSEIIMELPLPIITGFQFKRIQADIGWQNEKLDITTFAAEGPQMDGSLSGAIQIKTPFETSRIQFAGVVYLKPEFLARLKVSFPAGAIPSSKTDGGGIPFQIAGTLEAPLFSLK